jgi:hypothetical protein
MKFLPVIHVRDNEQAKANADIAFQNGADGVFLINHAMRAIELIDAYAYVRSYYPKKWIGLNFLDLDLFQTPHYLPRTANGLWVDDSGVYDTHVREGVEEFYRKLESSMIRENRGLQYFGGVAFKYQISVDPARATIQSIGCMDIITTSGVGTGKAPDVEKIKSMFAVAMGRPIAIASGLTPLNLHLFFPYIDYALVSTGISSDFEWLSAERVLEFKRTIERLT